MRRLKSINSCTLVDNVVKFLDRCGKAAFGLLNDLGWMKEGERIMGKIKVTTCEIEGLYVIEPTVFKDERGYFMETYNQNDFKEAGLNMTFVQDNQSMSVRRFKGPSFPEAVSSGQAGTCGKGNGL